MTNMENFKECKLNGLCGGCLHQGVPYEEQHRLKNQQVLDLFDRFHVDASVYQGMVPAETPYRYRNKMEYTFGDVEIGGPLELGMHQKGRFMSIVTCDECQLVPEDFNRILSATLNFCRERKYSFYHKKTHAGLLRNLVVRHGVRSNEVLVTSSPAVKKNLTKPDTWSCFKDWSWTIRWWASFVRSTTAWRMR